MPAMSHGTIGCMPPNHVRGAAAGGRISFVSSDTALVPLGRFTLPSNPAAARRQGSEFLRRCGLEAELRLERHACEHAGVEVLTALDVLDQNAGLVAVAALRGR